MIVYILYGVACLIAFAVVQAFVFMFALSAYSSYEKYAFYVSYMSINPISKSMPVSEQEGSSVECHAIYYKPNGVFRVSSLLDQLIEKHCTPHIFLVAVVPLKRNDYVSSLSANAPVAANAL